MLQWQMEKDAAAISLGMSLLTLTAPTLITSLDSSDDVLINIKKSKWFKHKQNEIFKVQELASNHVVQYLHNSNSVFIIRSSS